MKFIPKERISKVDSHSEIPNDSPDQPAPPPPEPTKSRDNDKVDLGSEVDEVELDYGEVDKESGKKKQGVLGYELTEVKKEILSFNQLGFSKRYFKTLHLI